MAPEEQLLKALDPDEAAQLRALLVRVARSTDPSEPCSTTPAPDGDDVSGDAAAEPEAAPATPGRTPS